MSQIGLLFLPIEMRLEIYGRCSLLALLQLSHTGTKLRNEINSPLGGSIRRQQVPTFRFLFETREDLTSFRHQKRRALMKRERYLELVDQTLALSSFECLPSLEDAQLFARLYVTPGDTGVTLREHSLQAVCATAIPLSSNYRIYRPGVTKGGWLVMCRCKKGKRLITEEPK
ncbi:hypothetical protein BJ508DRAFT_156260 [Ascobolus immersus RN42]|uniref:F-box domain-containing protein n=1 Tax=Ascobolus immersus RN42 TaxID=1160509 RepID=A0A3N4I285_ASCIM|nr:hypothetical protein BJ508DRAFT_156260 [Ascobolus immersus RN42]